MFLPFCRTFGCKTKFLTSTIDLFRNRRWRLDRPKQKAAAFMLNLKKNMQHMHGIITKLFDGWADPVSDDFNLNRIIEIINIFSRLDDRLVKSCQILRLDRFLALLLSLFSRQNPLHALDHHQVPVNGLRRPATKKSCHNLSIPDKGMIVSLPTASVE